MSVAQQPQYPDLVPLETARSWLGERTKLAAELAEAQAKVSPLQTRIVQVTALLNAAAAIVPEIQEMLDVDDERAMGVEGVALTAAIKKALLVNKATPVGRDNIKIILPQHGYTAQKLQANPNYFYTALKRLAARKEITEGPPGHFRLSAS